MISTSTATIYAMSSLFMGLFALFAVLCVFLLFVWAVALPLRAFWRVIKSFLNPDIGHR